LLTTVLNSDIISGVTAFWSTPLAEASDFCQAAALVHRRGGDDSVFIRQRLQMFQFAGGEFIPSLVDSGPIF
jgi:hypothetical protein